MDRKQTDTVMALTGGQFAAARSTLATAFENYPLMKYAAPGRETRRRGVQRLYGAFLGDSLRHGQVLVDENMRGACCWLPPNRTTINLWRQLRAGMAWLPAVFGWRGFRILVAYDELAAQLHHRHAPRAHWYVAAVGVAPAYQGQGIASLVLRPIIERADREGLPCYLETHDANNVAIYRRFGFDVVEEATPAGHPVSVWAMLREARSPDQE